MGAKYAGIAVLALIFAFLVYAMGVTVWVVAVAMVFAIVWATGAVVHNDWWPFRHL